MTAAENTMMICLYPKRQVAFADLGGRSHYSAFGDVSVRISPLGCAEVEGTDTDIDAFIAACNHAFSALIRGYGGVRAMHCILGKGQSVSACAFGDFLHASAVRNGLREKSGRPTDLMTLFRADDGSCV